MSEGLDANVEELTLGEALLKGKGKIIEGNLVKQIEAALPEIKSMREKGTSMMKIHQAITLGGGKVCLSYFKRVVGELLEAEKAKPATVKVTAPQVVTKAPTVQASGQKKVEAEPPPPRRSLDALFIPDAE